ncbi:MAG: hypothetical protein H6618_10000 [Deltaproteobacteria bacterium]|nr:hypothetical protein [Deltaproteobacteria bacterium]
MDHVSLTEFLMWCSVVNGSLLGFWLICWMMMPDVIYKLHSHWFSLPREQFNLALYCFFGLLKIFFIIFNLVPYLALRIMT